jgi:TonB family protein
MILSVVVVALWTSALLAAGAWAADRLLRAVRVQTRLAWFAAMAASVALVAIAPLRPLLTPQGAQAGELAASTGAASLASGITEVAAVAAQRLPAWTGAALLALWATASATTLLVLLAGYRRHRRLVLAAPEAVLAGTPVRVSEAFGPAVLGVARPVIVVPRWLLARSVAEQRLVIAHEREHIGTRDPLLLLAGAGMLVLLPWDPVMWWCFGRLRLAAELDCDARVLRAGAPPRTYGSLLLDLTAASPTPRFGAPAFAARPSRLEQRLLAMTTRHPSSRRRRATIAAAALVSAAALFAACTAEVQEPVVAATDTAQVAVAAGTIYFDFQTEKPATPVAGSGAPRYPDILRSAGVEGQVLAQFVVDTTGRVVENSFKLIEASHDLFAAAVRNALPAMRFTPAELRGARVNQLVQQPFVFQLAQ